MTQKKIRFVWATPPLSGGDWHFGLLNRRLANNPAQPLPAGKIPDYWKRYLRYTLYFSVRGLLLWGGGLALCAWFAGAAVIYLRHEGANPHNRVGYLDIALPTRWSQRERLQGEGLILLARDQLADGHVREGFNLLRLGLDKNPGDFSARLDLARLYLGLRLRAQAEKLLRAGLDLGYPGRPCLELAFTLAAEGDQPATWVELARLACARLEQIPADARPAGDAAWIDAQLARALLADSRPADALALVAERYPESAPFRLEISILARFAQNDPAEARQLCESWAAVEPASAEPLRLLARACREQGDLTALDAALARLRALDPTTPDALIYAVVQYHHAGRPERVDAIMDELFFRHGSDPRMHAGLATVLATLGADDRLPRLARELAEQGLSPRTTLLAELQLHLAAHRWREAMAVAARLRDLPDMRDDEALQRWTETMGRLARACADGGGAENALLEIVADHPGTLFTYRMTIDCLLAADRIDAAARVLVLAEGPYPASDLLASRRAEIDRRRAALAASAPIASPAPDAESSAFADLDALSAAFAARIKSSDTAGALALLSAAARAKPGWLAGKEHRLDALELPLRARGDDATRMLLLARSSLARDPSAPESLLRLAREIAAENHRTHAILLVKEILRHDPGQADALAQLATWEPARPDVALGTRP